MIISTRNPYPTMGSERMLIDVLDSMKRQVASNSDCLECAVMTETGEDGMICYLEQWRNRMALDQHLRSPLYGRVLEAMEFSHSPPAIEFMEATGIGGLDLVARARIQQ